MRVTGGVRHHIWVREAVDEEETGSESDVDLDEAIGNARACQQHRGWQGQNCGMDAGTCNFLLDVAEFLAIFNGPWWEKGFVHYCAGVQCCASPAHTAERMVSALRRVVFRHIPSTPAANRWRKLGPVIDTLILGLLCHQAFLLVFLKLRVKAGAAQADMDIMRDMRLTLDLDLSAVTGTRYHAARKFLLDEATSWSLTVLGLALEPVRFLTAWWMRRARCEDVVERVASMDIQYPPTSPLICAAQYLASMLWGACPRLQMLWRPAGCASLDDWCTKFPEQMRT